MHPEEIVPTGDDLFYPDSYDRWHPVGDSVLTWPARDRPPYCGSEGVLVLGEPGMPYGVHACYPHVCHEWRCVRLREVAAIRSSVLAESQDCGWDVVVWTETGSGVDRRAYKYAPEKPFPLAAVMFVSFVALVLVFTAVSNL
ncbi:hypothetical protein [Rhodococcus qingshengii]|uniref:hypothetical protein n=1 Tax=Rhodococcus qingshengii TaxID=334542 RepID=UPI0035E32EB6